MRIIPEKIVTSKTKLEDIDVLLTLFELNSGRSISRKKIAERTGLTERCVRNALDLLREHGMIAVDSWGVRITDYGRRLLNRLRIEPIELDMGQYISDSSIQCVIVRETAHRLDDGRRQRDAAAREGCTSCTMWSLTEEGLTMVPGWDTDRNDPVLAGMIREQSGLSERDVLIVAGADDPVSARNGALNAALSLR